MAVLHRPDGDVPHRGLSHPPLELAFLVIVSGGVVRLDPPGVRLMMFTHAMPGNRAGPLPAPAGSSIIVLPAFNAVIVRTGSSAQADGPRFSRRLLSDCALSWYVNGKPSAFTSMQVSHHAEFLYSLVLLRFDLYVENEHQLLRWSDLHLYATMQFFITYGAKGRAKYHPITAAVCSPEGFRSAHTSATMLFALLCCRWWVCVGHRLRRKRWASSYA